MWDRCLRAVSNASIIFAALLGALSFVCGLLGIAFNGASTGLDLLAARLTPRKREEG